MAGKIIEPKILKGTRDFGPEQMAKRLHVINKMRTVFARYGYDTIETPAIEYAETILGKYGDEGDKLTYTFADNGGRRIALRYDQTVPTARFVAANWSDLPIPFKRYQIGPVWRADKPQRGRYREFYQCDIDIIGSKSLEADAEIAKVIDDVFTTLDVTPFVIRVNSRALLDELLDLAGVDKELRTPVIRIIDKLDKIEVSVALEELVSLGLTKKSISALQKIMLNESVRHDVNALPEVASKKTIQGLFALCREWGIPDSHIKLDLTLARGLDYYTGVIYEVIIPDSGLGSVCGGGRYDNLTGLFSTQVFPGTGVAFGLDRLMVWLEENHKLDGLTLNSTVLVAMFADHKQNNIRTLAALHAAGINAELYLEEAKLQKQFKYADKKRIPFVILQGSDETKTGRVCLRNMQSGEQEVLTIEEAIKRIKGA
ncbi:MAG: histidine--tRNA ligase [Parcubacteria group bacterium]|nr:histidine--tRNA ligase [Parcubacteria group bacterium]